MKVGCQVLWWWVKMMMMMMAMTSTLRDRLEEKGGRRGGGGARIMKLISHPGSDLRHISLITNFIMEGGSCHCVQWALWIYTLCLPFQQQQQQHCPLSVETSVILWQFMRPFEPSRYWTDFAVSDLHPSRSIRTWKDVKESIWMNKWCRPSAKDGTGKGKAL